MAVFSSLAAFFRRHKRKIIFTSTASVTAYLLFYQFVIKRFRNFQNALKQELYVKEQIKRRYIKTQTDCYLTILALLPVLTHPIMAHLPTEAITTALKRKKNANKEMNESLTTENLLTYSEGSSSDVQLLVAKSKLELWDDLKVKSITRILSLIYAYSGLLLLTRLQLNILARKSYLESAIAMAGGTSKAGTPNTYDYFIEQSYLSLSWWLLNSGWIDMTNKLEKLVERKFRDISPKTELTVETLGHILSEINEDAVRDTLTPVTHSIFPVKYESLIETLMNTNPELVDELENKDSNLVKLINETNFIFTNEFTQKVLFRLTESGISTLCENIQGSLGFENRIGRANKLATYLAQISVQSGILKEPQSYSADDETTGNIYINRMNDIQELEEFSASIYSNFE